MNRQQSTSISGNHHPENHKGEGSRPRARRDSASSTNENALAIMQRESERVIVVGAGPVGLCLSLALAQAGVEVCTIETLGEDNFLEKVPRAGTNHPATLELYERIGLYEKLEPRGIIAPLFHYWDRREHRLIAEFDHAHLKEDTRFPYVLQCERIKVVEEALKLAKAHSNIDVRLSTTFTGFIQAGEAVTARVTNAAGECESVS